jgi:hypothetical protein
MATLADVLAGFEKGTDAFEDFQVYEALKAVPDGGSPAEDEQARWERMAFRFDEGRADDGTGWGTHFGPMAVLRGADGRVLEVPSITDVSSATLAYWNKRAEEASHPLLRMRYADLVWDLAPKATSAKRNPLAARVAIDAALELASRSETGDVVGRRKLARALQLAKAISDHDRFERIRDAMIDFEERRARHDVEGAWVDLYDVLIESKEDLALGQEEQIIEALEARLKRVVGADGTGQGDPLSARDIAVRLARYYRRKDRKDDLRRVLRLSADVFALLSKQASPLLGMQWMREVYDTYREFGFNDEADALNPVLADLGKRSKENLRPLTREIQIPREVFDRLEEAVAGVTLEESLGRVAGLFLVDAERAEREVQRLATEFPLQGLMRQTYLDADGRVESEVGGVHEDLRGRVIVQMSQMVQLQWPLLHHALSTVFKRFSVRPEELADVFGLSPVYPAERRPFFLRSFRAYCEEDWMACVHVLVPQIEQAVRTLVILLGGSHVRPHQHRGMVYRPLDDLLRDPMVRDVVGEKTIRHLQVVLTDQRGLNLRNLVCHGYGTEERFEANMADLLLHASLLLAGIRTRRTQTSE